MTTPIPSAVDALPPFPIPMNAKVRDTVFRYGFAIFCTAVATYVRIGITPFVGDRLPFETYFLSLMLVAWLAGAVPAVFALFLSTLAAGHFVVAPERSLLIENPHDQIALAIFFMVGTISIGLFQRLDSQRREAEEQAKKNELLNRELVELDGRKDEFLSLLSHELRCPLAPMRYAVEMLQSVASDPEQVNHTSRVFARNLTHLVRLVDDLLDVSRYSRGTLNLQCVTTDFRDCVRSAVEMVRPACDAKQHELFVDLPAESIMIHADPIRCSQIVCNLLTNAVKYTTPNGRIHLCVKVCPEGLSTVVEDDGIGLAESIHKRVFEPFFQAHSKRSKFSAGMGLGLAIANKLAELHAGWIELESEGLGRGSKFSFFLPSSVRREQTSDQSQELALKIDSALVTAECPRVQSPDFDNMNVTNSISPPSTDVDGNKRVLIVDDDRDTANSLSFLLSLEGYETKVAFDGLTALNECQTLHPQYFVLDIGLPGIDGYEIARRIRREPNGEDVTIVGVSGWGSPRDRQLGQEAGFDFHLVKPVSVAELVSILVAGSERSRSMKTIATSN